MYMQCLQIFIFLSIQAQDFIEENEWRLRNEQGNIPEHSSSGLH